MAVLLFGLPLPVRDLAKEPGTRQSRTANLSALRGIFNATLSAMDWSQKEAAMTAGLGQSDLSTQMRHHGPNLLRLLDLGRGFWRHFIKPLSELAGLTRADVLAAFDVDSATEDDLKRRQTELEEQLAEQRKRADHQQEQIDELLRRLPPAVVHPVKERQSA